ncbi:MAG: hypothetical protein ACRD0C_03095, partial [Acidimicrobiia bacterium]
ANRALTVASVVGLVFGADVLQAAGDLAEDALIAALEEASAASLLVEIAGPGAARYRFSHALVRATLYDELNAARRVALHRRVGEAIETLYGQALDDQLPALAHHWSRAAAPAADAQRAIDYSARAGDRALAQLAHDEAAAYYRQALELLEVAPGHDGDRRRMNLLISLGEAQRRIGDAAHRETLLEAGTIARQRGDAVAMARAALANSRGTFSRLGRVDADRVEFLEATIEALGHGAPALRARLLATLAAELLWSGDADRRRRLIDEALELARGEGDPVVLGQVLLLRWATLWNPRWARERLELATRITAIADATGDPHLGWFGVWRQTLAAMELGDTQADRTGQAAARVADELGHSFPKWCVKLTVVSTTLRSGALTEAEARAEEAGAFGRQHGHTDAEIAYNLQIAGIRYEQGRLGELEPLLREMATRFGGVPFFRAMLALAYCELGQDEAARSTFEPLSTDDPYALVGDDWFATPTTALLAMLASELGSTGDAAALAGVIAPYADQVASYPIWLGTFSHHLGRLATTLGLFAEAEAYFLDAAAAHQRLGAPAWLARTRLECARMLLRRNGPADADRARSMLGGALGVARDLGLAGVERQAVSLLA